MTDDEKFFFDLKGFLLLKNVLTPAEVAHCNEAIDRHGALFFETERVLEGESRVLGGMAKQKWMEGMLAWERPWCEPFRELMVQPHLKPYLAELLGSGYRLDHGPLLIAMDKGNGGHLLHGGAVERQDFSQTYYVVVRQDVLRSDGGGIHPGRRGAGRRGAGRRTLRPQG